MKPFLDWYTRIHFFSALVAISLQSLVLKNILNSTLPNPACSILMASATYYLLYRVLIYIYEKGVWKMVLKEYNIDGIWYHEFRSKSNPTYCRQGITEVKQKGMSLTIDGRNYNEDFDPACRTLWNSKAVTVDEAGRIVLSYEAHTYDYRERPAEKTGIIIIKIICQERIPVRMIGVFHDSSPPFERGTVTWWRTAEWQGKISQL